MLLLTNGDNNKPYGLLPPDSSSRKALDIFQHLGWGSHLCLLYQQKTDLLNLLVPYIQAGLENHEYCICISAEPLYLQQTHIALWKAIPEFGQYYKKGQIAFISSKEWHLGKGKVRVDDLAHRCFSRLNQALAQGYNGLRISTHNTWMQNKYWNSFQDYEACLDNMIQDYKMITMCSYSLDKCQATHILDLCRNHQCTYIYSPEGCQAIKRADIDTTPDRSHVNSPIPTHYFLGQRTVDPNPNLHILNEMLQAEIRRHSRTEEALHLSDHRYRSLFNTIDEGFSIYKICQSNNGPREYQCLDVNPAFAALLGYPQEYLIGKKLEQALPELYEELNPYLDMVAPPSKSKAKSGKAEVRTVLMERFKVCMMLVLSSSW
jgi:PAS domain-containing protein